jgi:hypothetical protein
MVHLFTKIVILFNTNGSKNLNGACMADGWI